MGNQNVAKFNLSGIATDQIIDNNDQSGRLSSNRDIKRLNIGKAIAI